MMPTISMFYGVLVTIYYEDGGRHHTPHIHVRYQGRKASIAPMYVPTAVLARCHVTRSLVRV